MIRDWLGLSCWRRDMAALMPGLDPEGGTYLLSRSGTPYGLTNGISYQAVSVAYRPVRTLSGSNYLRRS
ncbi:hypothetical protein CEP53_008597 [Fusarium sp. AF-6]|nr:hypothetical protein CEP53_008597 [Fusarium sp. AF-6]